MPLPLNPSRTLPLGRSVPLIAGLLAAVAALAACGSSSVATTATFAPSPGAPALSRDLTGGVTVGADCTVSGFDGVLANKKPGTECNQDGLAADAKGLTLTSSAGQLANGNQQNALYDVFDAATGGFLIHARVTGPITQLTTNYQQIVLWFGPDTDNFVKVEAEHGNGQGPDPHMTMYWDEKGKAGPLATISVPELTTAATLDLYIRADKSHHLTGAYSLDEGVHKKRLGSGRTPADIASWFSATSAKAGILTSNSGSTTTFATTFTKFDISAG